MTNTLSSYMEEWLQGRDEKRDAYNEYLRWRKHIRPAAFANTPLASVSKLDIKKFLKELSQTKSEQTVRHVLRQIKQTFAEAEDNGIISYNPTKGVQVPRQDRTEDTWTYLQPQEIETILACEKLTERERSAIGLAIFTGLRLGELLHLHWKDVVLDGPRPHVTVRYSNGGASKSGKPGITPLLPMAVQIFRFLASKGAYSASELVLPNNRGLPYAKGHDFGWRDWKNNAGKLVPGAKTRAGITRPVRFHNLRHTAAAALMSGYWGDPWRIEEVRDFMRHGDISMTQKYAHLDPAGLHKKAATLSLVATAADVVPNTPKTLGNSPLLEIADRLQALEAVVAGHLMSHSEHLAREVLALSKESGDTFTKRLAPLTLQH